MLACSPASFRQTSTWQTHVNLSYFPFTPPPHIPPPKHCLHPSHPLDVLSLVLPTHHGHRSAVSSVSGSRRLVGVQHHQEHSHSNATQYHEKKAQKCHRRSPIHSPPLISIIEPADTATPQRKAQEPEQASQERHFDPSECRFCFDRSGTRRHQQVIALSACGSSASVPLTLSPVSRHHFVLRCSPKLFEKRLVIQLPICIDNAVC